MSKKLFLAMQFIIAMLCTTQSFSQTPTYELKVSNVVQTSGYELEFDVYIRNTGANSFDLRSFQFGLIFNSAITSLNNGTAPGILHHSYIVPSIVPNTSQLLPLNQPQNVSFHSVVTSGTNYGTAAEHSFNCFPTPSSSGTPILPTPPSGCTTPGTRIARFKMRSQTDATNTTPINFATGSLPNMTFSTTSSTNIYATAVITTGPFPASVITNYSSHFNYNTPGTCIINFPLNPVPVITSITPGTIKAGIGSILTINGSNFGSSRGTNGNLLFKNANDGGATTIELDNSDWTISTWSDNQITVALPSVVAGGTPGSGVVSVRNNFMQIGTSASPLNISLAVTGIGLSKKRARLAGNQCVNGFRFYYGSGAVPTAAQQTVIAQACNDWATYLNIEIILNSTLQPAATTNNGYSTIYIDNSLPLNSKVNTSRYYTICTAESFITEADIAIRNAGVTWHTGIGNSLPSGASDLYGTMLREIGRVLGLEYSIDLTNGTKNLMNSAVLTGPQSSTNRPTLVSGGALAANGAVNEIVVPSRALPLTSLCLTLTPLTFGSTSTPYINYTATGVCTNDPVILTCQGASGFGTSYLWSNGQTTSQITIINSGTYTCQVNYFNCSLTTPPITITGLAPSIISSHPTNQITCGGGSASYSVSAPGGSSFQWQRRIAGGAWSNLSNGSFYNNVTTPTLTVTNAQYYNGSLQEYACLVKQGGSCTQLSNPATLSVQLLTLQPFSSVYNNAPVFTLTGGSPSGGTYSGPGVSGGSFNASIAGVGYHTITYSKAGCTSTASQIIQVVQSGAPTITCFIPGGSQCINGAPVPLSVAYTPLGTTFNSGNVFTVQLSGPTGSFSTFTNIGSVTSTTGGTIMANIPTNVSGGTGYRIRVVSSNPIVTGSLNQGPFTISLAPCSGDRINNHQSSEAGEEISVFPNPATNFLQIQLPEIHSFNKIMLADATGKIYVSKLLDSDNLINLDLANIPSGIYFITFSSQEFLLNKKVIIIK